MTATTVDPRQVVEGGAIPLTSHDFGLDLVVTPDEAIRTATAIDGPTGVLWDRVENEKRAAIPVLAAR